MKKINIASATFHLIALFLLVFSLSGCSLPLKPLSLRSQGALQVTTPGDTVFSVYLDGNYMGQTPFFDEKIKIGEYTLGLYPQNSDQSIWQVKIPINKRSLSVINYTHSPVVEQRSSEVIYLQPLNDSHQAKLSISTLPDHVVVKLQGQVQGFSPLSFDTLDAGEYQITLEAPGYVSKNIQARTIAGQHLVIQAQLGQQIQPAREATASPVAPPEIQPQETPPPSRLGTQENGVSLGYQTLEGLSGQYVKILPATVGINWLRVRGTPNAVANNEVARVRVGDYFKYIQDSDNQEWRLIEYAPGKQGWVTLRYGQLSNTSPESP